MKNKGMNETQFLALLEKVLPKATKDTHLASAIYDEVARELRLQKSLQAFEKFCERVELPEPHRGDILAIPATGAYTLAMSSSYNAVPRPAAVLVADGAARVIRRRETIDDLLALER